MENLLPTFNFTIQNPKIYDSQNIFQCRHFSLPSQSLPPPPYSLSLSLSYLLVNLSLYFFSLCYLGLFLPVIQSKCFYGSFRVGWRIYFEFHNFSGMCNFFLYKIFFIQTYSKVVSS